MLLLLGTILRHINSIVMLRKNLSIIGAFSRET